MWRSMSSGNVGEPDLTDIAGSAVAAEAMGGEKRTSTTLITTVMIECVLTPMTM